MAAEKEEVADTCGGGGGDTILLISSDGEHFNVPAAAASLSQLISNMIEDDCTTNGVPLPNVSSKVLAKVIDYCVKHAAAAEDEEKELKSFDAEFIDVDKNMLYGFAPGVQFPEHQEPAGFVLPAHGEPDQRQVAGADQEGVWDQERLHAGGGGNPQGEHMGLRVDY
uniref:SKP1 component POZ domain-containing protein n=1 Tax=Oryza meridionalis TaxID=40149 RepID=A0A0E0E7A4_9ORYZ